MNQSLMDRREIIDSLEVCQTYTNDGFFQADIEEREVAMKHFLWVQARLGQIMESLAVHIEELIK